MEVATATTRQPIFCPVLNENYATRTALDWNVIHSGVDVAILKMTSGWIALKGTRAELPPSPRLRRRAASRQGLIPAAEL